jgi:hypothetical protein
MKDEEDTDNESDAIEGKWDTEKQHNTTVMDGA